MSNNELERQIKELNNKIAELALIVSLKTKEMDNIEKRYSERIDVLNSYLARVRSELRIQSQEGHIDDIAFIDKLRSTSLSDDNVDYVLIPTKPVKMTVSKHTKSERTSTELQATRDIATERTHKVVSNETTRNRKKKISCSYCNEKGHKRSQCPKILYHGV